MVNLTAYETYFQEKRPFFTEGRNILDFRMMSGDGDFGSDNLFYSRRIGRAPQYYPETQDGEFLDMPMTTAILGAFKVTGKTTPRPVAGRPGQPDRPRASAGDQPGRQQPRRDGGAPDQLLHAARPAGLE